MTGGSTKENLEKPSLPSDWSIKKLRELCSQIQDGTHFTPQYVEYGIPFYSVESVTARNFLVSKYVTQEAHDVMARRCRPQRGDILMTRIGSLGDTAVVDWDHEASIYVSLALLRPGKAIDEAYLYAYTRSKAFATEVESRSLPNAIPKKINLGDIGDVEIWVPESLHEQQAIAAALYDADGVVAGLERVIAKKRLIKQGAMQDLLTARRRLPGFSGEWSSVKLGACASVISKGTTPTSIGHAFVEHGINFIKVESLLAGRSLDLTKVAAISEATHSALRRSQLQAGDILISIAGAIGRVGVVEQAVLPANTNQALAFVRLHNRSALFPGFVPYILESEKVLSHWDEISVQGAQPNISLSDVRNLDLPCPPYAEQQAIATVLSDMDAEIQTLDSRLVKARAVKEGMMQNLLTGRVRLV